MVPATIVQLHRHAHVLIDEAAAEALDYCHHHGIIEPKYLYNSHTRIIKHTLTPP